MYEWFQVFTSFGVEVKNVWILCFESERRMRSRLWIREGRGGVDSETVTYVWVKWQAGVCAADGGAPGDSAGSGRSSERENGAVKRREEGKLKERDVKMCVGSNDQLMLNSAFVWRNTVTTATVHSTIITHMQERPVCPLETLRTTTRQQKISSRSLLATER